MPRSNRAARGPAAISSGALAVSFALACLLGACGQKPPTASAQARPVVDLTLAHSDGSLFELAQLRGKPLLLFLFATYDSSSQLALTHLERMLEHEPALPTLGIALQPGAKAFLDPYRDALSVSFPLSYDPEGVVLPGETSLGSIASVPGFVLLDAQGHLLGARYGVLTEARLRDFIAPVLDD